MRKRVVVPAVRDRDLQAILAAHGLAPDFEASRLHCPFCAEVLTWDNIGGILVQKQEPVLFCNLPDCIEQASSGRASNEH